MSSSETHLTRTQRQIEEYRKGTARIEVRDARGRAFAGADVWVEQEAHEFPFSYVTEEAITLSGDDWDRYDLRLHEVFNRIYRASQCEPTASNVIAVEVPERVHLGSLRYTLDRAGDAGTQLDVYVSGRCVAPPLGLRQQDSVSLDEPSIASRVVELYTLCFSHPAVRQILWKGFSDREARVVAGGLLRCDLSPTRAQKLLRKLIGTTWHTRASGRTDAQGVFQFRGFFGTYRVVVTCNRAKAHVIRLSLGRDADAAKAWVVDIPAE